MVHVGRDTTIKAEYAETQAQDSPSYVSTDGGITFTELASANSATGKAYGITQESRLFDRLGLKSYYKWIGQNFSAAASSPQQGKELKGLAMTFDITPVTRLTATQDIQKLIASGTLQTQMQVGAQQTTTTDLQLVHEAQRLRLTAEYQRQEVSGQNAVAETAANTAQQTVAVKAEYDLDEKTKLALSHQVGVSGGKQQQASVAISRQLTEKLAMKLEETTGTQGTATKVSTTANVTPKLSMTTDYTLARDSTGATSKTAGISGKGQIGEKTALEAGYSVTQANGQKAQGLTTVTSNTQSGSSILQTQAQTTGSASQAVNLSLGTQIDDATIKVGTQVANAVGQTSSSQGLFVDATKSNKDGTTTAVSVKKNSSATLDGNVGIGSTIVGSGALNVFTVSQSGKMATGQDIVAEHSMGYGPGVEQKGETYKVVQNINGRKVETDYTRQYAQNQTERSDSNIFGLTGDVNDRWAANAQLEQGKLQNIDGTLTKRVAVSGGVGYVGKNEAGKEALKSSTKVEARFDNGAAAKRQYLVSHATEGLVGEETTLSSKLEYSVTKNLDTGNTEAQYKEIVLGAAYRPIANDRLNFFARYTYQQNQAPSGQEAATTDVEQTRMQVLAVEGAYDLTDEWQIVEKLAYRIMEEKVAGFEFTKTHTWLLINRANYRLSQDWKIGAEYRILSQQEAQDQKSGFLVEAVRSLNDNMELAVGYNLTDFVDDLTNLSYNVQGPYVRITGKLYDRTPEERARARAKWIERRVERYAWKMVANELTRKDSAIVFEMNQMYRTAQVAQEKGQYEQANKMYKGIIQATEMMFQEAAQFVRKHIDFEEKLFNAYQRAQEYYDKGEYWMARKLWEKIVEEAERSMLK
jgi:tetratricopeptide (TPR) repeat protein